MLTAKLSSGEIEIKESDILLKRKSPLFAVDGIEGDISFPFSIPLTPQISALLNHPSRTEVIAKNFSQKMQLTRNGIPILSGDLIIGDASELQVETTLLCGSSPFSTHIKDLFLDELNLGSIQFSTEAALIVNLNSTINGNFTSSPWHLPGIYAPNLINASDIDFINYARPDYINPLINNSFKLRETQKKYYLSPMLYFHWLIPKIFESLGYHLVDKVFNTDDELKQAVFFNMHNITDQDNVLIIRYADLLPHYKLSTFIIDLSNFFEILFTFDNHTQTITIDWKKNSLTNYSSAKSFKHSSVTVKQKNKFSAIQSYCTSFSNDESSILPAIQSESDFPDAEINFLKYIYVTTSRKSYLSVFQNNTFLWIQWDLRIPSNIIPDLMFIVQTFSELPIPQEEHNGKYAYVIDEVTIYMGYNAQETGYEWAEQFNILVNTNVNAFKIGSGEFTKIESGIGTLDYRYTTSSFLITYNSYLEKKTIAPKLLFAKYLLATTNYPNIKIIVAHNSSANYSFFWTQGDNFIQNKKLPFWLFLLNAKPIECNILLNDMDIANWDWNIPLKIGNSLAMVDEMEIPLGDNSNLLDVKITAWTL